MVIKKRTIINVLLMIANITVITNVSANKELEGVKTFIRHNFINQPTSAIAQKIEKGKPIQEEFQDYLDTDAMMQGALHINQQGASATKLSVIQLSKDMDNEFTDKEKELVAKFELAVTEKRLAQVVTAVGAIFILASFSEKSGGTPMSVIGSVMAAGGGGSWYYFGNKVDTIPAHLNAVTTMKEKLNHSFVVVADKKQ